MQKISVKNIYLLLIISVGLIVLGVGSTFAMFTASAEINNPITIASNLNYESDIFDTIDVSLDKNEIKKITINVSNTSSETLYYALWYINNSGNDIEIGLIGNDTAIGNIAPNAETKVYSVLIHNKSNDTASVTIGLLTNDSQTFNLGNGMELIPSTEFSGGVNKLYSIYTPNSTVTEGDGTTVDNIDTVNQIVEDPNGNLHYYGQNPNNYIKFNCSSYPETACELWRIIGIVDGKLKLMRNQDIGRYSWDTTLSANNGQGMNDWAQSALKNLLNPGASGASASNSLYYYSESGNCYSGVSGAKSSCDFTSTGLKENTRDLIEESVWKTGGYDNYSIYPNQMLNYERGTIVVQNPTDGYERHATWTGKVAIPYPSEYGYATDLSKCNKTLVNYSSSDNSYACRGNNWMWYILTKATTASSDGEYFSAFITPFTSTQYYEYGLNKNGLVGSMTNSTLLSVVPTLYLKENIDIDTSHAGSSTDPYTLNIKDFKYTGDIQEYTIPKTGTYLLETWGAQGGSSLCNGTECTAGGYGSYSSGEVTLNKDDKIYAAVGGKGSNGIVGSNAPGGYNGGGLGTWDGSDDESSGGGGGATHIATKTGLLSSLSSNISNILIVSGGGGGASWKYEAGSGGGMNGGISSKTNPNYPTQTSGYAFGQGENGYGTGDSDGVAGAGGGFYGGYVNSVSALSSGTGGSGYIGNSLLTNKVMYCYNCTESNEESTKTISTTNASSDPMANYAKLGNGYARITFIK